MYRTKKGYWKMQENHKSHIQRENIRIAADLWVEILRDSNNVFQVLKDHNCQAWLRYQIKWFATFEE